MEKISDGGLESWIGVLKNANGTLPVEAITLKMAFQEIKERREADKKPLGIKDQLRMAHDRCPDLWSFLMENNAESVYFCPDDYDIESGPCLGVGYPYDNCTKCWDEALKEGEE